MKSNFNNQQPNVLLSRLLQENTLLFTVDLIKEMLSDAYKSCDALVMAKKILDIIRPVH